MKPYLAIRVKRYVINPAFPSQAMCCCGHRYIEHFDYDGRNTGCQCGCKRWREPDTQKGTTT